MAIHVKSHNDLDAVGLVVVLKRLGYDIASISYHGYPTIDASITKHLKESYSKDDLLLIADICPSDSVLEEINRKVSDGAKVVLLDHHKTKLSAAKYKWATIDLEKCGTELVYDRYKPADWDSPALDMFVEAVSAWDLWKLDSECRKRSENLNSLLGFIGKGAFVKEFSIDLTADFRGTFAEVIKYLEKRKKKYVKQVIKKQLEHVRCYKDGFNNRFKILFATDYISEIGNAALDHPEAEDLHYVCVINPAWNTCSLRARKGGVDVGAIAKFFGGGGHAAAAGFPCEFTESIEANVWQLLNRLNY